MAKAGKNPDVILVGAGIMSATLGVMLKELDPSLTIEVYERLDVIAGESSDAWNNAGTGHSAFCELNYTPRQEDGSINITKAVKIAEMFEISREFWAYLVKRQYIDNPRQFINPVPHMSFVTGEKDVQFLKDRYETLSRHPLFEGMKYTEDHKKLSKWIPLMMEDRKKDEPVAVTKMKIGTDVNFGALTRCLFEHLGKLDGVTIKLSQEVLDIDQQKDGRWKITYKDRCCKQRYQSTAGFIFIGAGGGALPLLEKSGIPEADGYGGFPVSGQWLVCSNPKLVEMHNAKVYGKAKTGAPPMSVPHLDTRRIKGSKALLFGPYAGFSSKFLKYGDWTDLPSSINLHNIGPMLSAGWHNLSLTKYLIAQVLQSTEDRMEALQEFIPDARVEDWELEIAGQRVQVIKKHPEHGGILEFGTEVVTSKDGTIAALLGASPGASTSVSIIIDLLNRCFRNKMQTQQWQDKMKQMICSYGQSLASDATLIKKSRAFTGDTLELNEKVLEEYGRQEKA
jgi:malate dehydrogenase (quinone)